MSFLKELFCLHEYVNEPIVKYYHKFVATPNPNGYGDKRLVICNKCGKTSHKDYNYIPITRIK